MVDKSQWRPVQFFLDSSPMSVAEVQVRNVEHPADPEQMLMVFRCTCKAFSINPLLPCNHIAVVFARVKLMGGTYITKMRRADIDPHLIESALHDLEAYRKLMLHESLIEVLEDAAR